MSAERTVGFDPRRVKPGDLAQITACVVDLYRPLKVYLFGSYARGEATGDSDIDLVVLLPDNAQEPEESSGLFRSLAKEHQWPVELHICRQTWFESRLHLPIFFPATVVREGQLLYES